MAEQNNNIGGSSLVDPSAVLSSNDLAQEPTASSNVPPWMRELLASGVTRQSRASSIVSTRTRFSTNTFQDDARSIDINVGGQFFRISRDGSRISDASPPPYSGSYNLPMLREAPARRNISDVIITAFDPQTRGTPETPDEELFNTLERERHLSRPHASLRANILDPSEVDMPSPIDRTSDETASLNDLAIDESAVPARIPSYKTGPDLIHVPSEARRLRTVSHNDVPTTTNEFVPIASPLRRRNGVRLPSLITQPVPPNRGMSSTSLTTATLFKSTSGSPLCVRSAGPVLSTLDGAAPEPQSPTYIGRDAEGIFPNREQSNRIRPSNSINEPETSTARPFPDLSSPVSPISHSNTPPAMDSENDISLHYTRIMRRLDHDHRKALHIKDKELASYRDRLNEMDVVYRQELKSRDFIIEDLKKRLAYLEENVEGMLEKARNQVEDIWEQRWREREICLREDLTGLVDRLHGKRKEVEVDENMNKVEREGVI